MKHTQDYDGLNYTVDSTLFWSKEDHESYDGSGVGAWLDKEHLVYRWCEKHPSEGLFGFCAAHGIFYFEYEQDRLLALLRWS